MILYRNTEVKVRSPDGDTDNFDMVDRLLREDTLATYLFIIGLDYVLRTSIDKIKDNGLRADKKRSRMYPSKTITDAENPDDIAILANAPAQAETLLHSLEKKLDGNYTRMLRAISKRYRWQYLTKPQLYGHLTPITQTI